MSPVGRILLIISFAGVPAANSVFPQDVEATLTADEIVSRHEVTLAKYKRYAVQLQTKSRRSRCGKFSEVGSLRRTTEGHVVLTDENDDRARFFVDADRLCAYFLSADGKREEKEILERDLSIRYSPMRVNIHPQEFPYNRFYVSWRFGSSIGTSCFHRQQSLREWVAEAHPSVTFDEPTSTRDALWRLTGKFKTDLAYSGEANADQAVDATIVLNASKGFLIQEMDFIFPASDLKLKIARSNWTVQSWHKLEGEEYFPEKTRCDISFRNLDICDSVESHFENIRLNPLEMNEQFVLRLEENTVVYDYTKRAGYPAVRIWGPFDKAKQTYRTFEEFHSAMNARTTAQVAGKIQGEVAKLFKGYVVTTEWRRNEKVFKTKVTDSSGIAIHEITQTQEMLYCDDISDYVQRTLKTQSIK